MFIFEYGIFKRVVIMVDKVFFIIVKLKLLLKFIKVIEFFVLIFFIENSLVVLFFWCGDLFFWFMDIIWFGRL